MERVGRRREEVVERLERVGRRREEVVERVREGGETERGSHGEDGETERGSHGEDGETERGSRGEGGERVMSQHHHQQHLQHTQQQQPQQAQAQALGSPGSLPQQQSSQAGMMSLSSPLGVVVSAQQKMRLQRIQLERERIQRRQEELMRQEVALCRQLPLDSESMAPVPTPCGNPAQPMTQGNMPTNGGHFQHSREQRQESESMAQAGSMNVSQHSGFPDFLDSLPGTNTSPYVQ
ncbi:unnamed protein product [Coregonus sp. 'balchen']|nr:unnamed protein product [Coregonus sp. 'balchen']